MISIQSITHTICSVAILAIFGSVCVREAIANSPWHHEGCELLIYPRSSADLSQEMKVRLGRLMPEIQKLTLGALVVTGWSDIPKTRKERDRQRALATQRAESIAQFYVEAGIPERLV
jgi:hypothetical protein